MIHSDKPAQAFNFYPFAHDFYNGQALYVYLFGELPEQTIIRQLDYPRALDILNSDFGQEIVQVLHKTGINCAGKKQEEKEESFLVLNGALLLELSFNYCIIYHAAGSDKALCGRIREKLAGVKKRQRRKPMEINIISQTSYGLELTEMEIKRTKLDVRLYYNDDFLPVDALIRQRLNRKKDKGIVLLHGLPGTGKTTYLRYLTAGIRKRVLFLPPDIAGRMAQPELVKLLIDNPDSVLIIEDAESILMQRRLGGDSAVSTLLNISDGLMSDFMNAQLVCTFNCGLENIDPALMRKGRLIARYEFGKLSVEKSNALSRHLGFGETITEPMTVAEISNQKDKSYEQPGRAMIGFKALAGAGS